MSINSYKRKIIISGDIVGVCDYKKPIIADYLSTKLSYVAKLKNSVKLKTASVYNQM